MELTSEQKHDISIQLNASDIYETVPFLNKVLAAIGYVDRLDDDSEREELRWTKRKEPLIKDKKIRKAVRAWAEALDLRWFKRCGSVNAHTSRLYGQDANGTGYTMELAPNDLYGDSISKEGYTIAELCGEED